MTLLILALVLLALGFVILVYNRLIAKKNQVTYAESGVDVFLKQRSDLIPNLVEATKQYMQHERDTFERIVQLRSLAGNPELSKDDQYGIENQIGKLLGKIMVSVENYPELKANENFLNLQNALQEVEAQLAAARRTFNAAVMEFNNVCEQFPTNIIANSMGFVPRDSFEALPQERANVDLKSLF